MKIVFFSTANSLVGGAIRSLLSIIDACKANNDICTVVLKAHGPIEALLKEKKIDYIVVRSYDWMQPKWKWSGFGNKIRWGIKSIINIIAEIRMGMFFLRNRPDIYYVNVVYNPCGVRAAKLLCIPIIWHMREFVNIDETNTDWFYNSNKAFRIMNYANKFVAITDSIKDYYSRYLPSNKIVRIYNGIDMPKVVKKRDAERHFFCITLSGAKKFKGHLDALEAVQELKKRGITNFKLILIGAFIDQEYYTFLQDNVNNKAINELVEFREFTADMESVFDETDIGLICSRYEPFSRYAVEIMARAIPLVCTRSAGVYEVTHYGEYCHTYEETNCVELADVLELIMNNYKYESDRAFSVSAIVNKEYSINNTTQSVINLISSVVH